jgi:hypothetical protein
MTDDTFLDYLPAKIMEDGFKILSLDRVQLFVDKVAVHGGVHVGMA